LGITWGLPGPTHLFSYQPDEFFSLRAALSLLAGDPNPHFFNYPSLYLYLAAVSCMIGHGASAMGATMDQLPVVLRSFTLDARLVTVLLALVTVGAAYGAATRLAGRRAGLLAAALVAVAPGHVLYSHFAAVDVPLACFMTLAVWAGIVLYDDRRWKIVVLAGLACGASAATKYNGLLVIVVPLLTLLLGAWRLPRPRPWAPVLLRCAAIVLIAAIAFAVFSPYVFLDWPQASHDIAFEMRHMREGEYPAKAADPCGWYFQARALSYALGGSIPLLALVALLALGVRSQWPRSLPLVVLALAWYLMIGAAGVRYARYGLPLVPLLAIGSAAAVATWQRTPSRLKSLPSAVAAGCAAAALASSVLLPGSMAFEVEPRDAALAWIDTNVPTSETVGIGRTVWFDMPPLDFDNGGDALGRQFAQFRRPVRVLSVIPGFNALRLRAERPPWFVETDFETAEWLRAGNAAATGFRQALEQDYRLDATFRRRWGWRVLGACGPLPHDWSYPFTTVRIWRLKASEDTPGVEANHAR
jgi:hypothetical protein